MSDTSSARVHFIGAGPGDPELLTLKAARLIGQADLVLYAGSLVPQAVVAGARPGARVVDSAPLTLEAQHELVMETVRSGGRVARVHTGDPSLYGTVQEQAALLDKAGVTWDVVPGVSAAFAAAAEAGRSFTTPGRTQTLMCTRMAGRTPVPEAEALRNLARHGSSLAVYLSAGDPEAVQAELLAAGLAPGVLVVVAKKVGWPDQDIRETALARLAETARAMDASSQTVFLVLPDATEAGTRSRLYDAGFSHARRKGG